MMQWVYEKITEYTGETDQDAIVSIYGFMADNVRAFGSLSPAQFRKEAREAKAVHDYLQTDAGKAYWEKLNAEMLAA